MKKKNTLADHPHVRDGTYQLIMTGSGWFGYTRHYATSDSPIVLVSKDREDAMDEIFRLQREADHKKDDLELAGVEAHEEEED